jgi:hypothetical protein
MWHSARVRGAKCHQPIRLDEGQWTEHYGIENRENSSAGANSKSKRQHRCGRECLRTRQLSPGVSEVPDVGFERRQSAHLSKVILHLRHSSKLPPRGEVSFFGQHALSDEPLRQHFQVNGGLVFKLLIHLAVAGHPEEPRKKYTQHKG